MKLIVASALLVLLGLTNVGAAKTQGPIEKVLQLLQGMKTRLEQDEASEQQVYDKYACWCEKTTARKASAIDKARTDLRAYGQEVLIQRGTIAQKTIQIQQTTQDIKSNEESQQELTSIRQKENAAYMAESAELKQATNAMERAIIVLRDATGFLQGSASSGAAAKATRALASVEDALAAAPSSALASRLSLLASFQTEMAKGARYAPQSATIQGILRDMYGNFANDLEGMDAEESDKNRAFEDLIAQKQTELLLLQEKLAAAEKAKAEAELLMAEAAQAYDDTEAQLKADIEFFDATKSACTSKSQDWKTRKEIRDEELKMVREALTLLGSDEARELFGKAINQAGVQQASFLQMASDQRTSSSVEDMGPEPTRQAYKIVKALAIQGRSIRLAQLAASVHSAKVGHFDKVLLQIDNMVKELKQEALDDIAKRDQCKDEYQSIESKSKDLAWKVEKNEAMIAKLEKQIADMEADKANTIEDIAALGQTFIDLNTTRKAENDAYKVAKSDDEQAIALLGEAKAMTESFYTKHQIEIGTVQGAKKAVLLQEDPEFEISADQAPEADFSHKGHRKMMGKGVVALLSHIIEDLHGEIAQAMQAEEAAQLEYEKQYKAAQELLLRLETKKTNLETGIAERGVKLSDEQDDKTNNEADLKSEQDYQKQLKPDCDFIIGSFAERVTKRKAEIDGLNQAKDYLAGYQESAAAAEDAALLQGRAMPKPRPFNDEALGRIGFLGLN